MKKMLICIAILLTTAEVFGDNIYGSGQWLHDDWLANQRIDNHTDQGADVMKAGEYWGFVEATKQIYQLNGGLDMPPSVAEGQVDAVVGKYLDDHPEEWNQPASVLVYKALRSMFPPKR
jgi:Rap1a immunity proteins